MNISIVTNTVPLFEKLLDEGNDVGTEPATENFSRRDFCAFKFLNAIKKCEKH